MNNERDALANMSGVLAQAQKRDDLDKETVHFIITKFNESLDEYSAGSAKLKIEKE